MRCNARHAMAERRREKQREAFAWFLPSSFPVALGIRRGRKLLEEENPGMWEGGTGRAREFRKWERFGLESEVIHWPNRRLVYGNLVPLSVFVPTSPPWETS